MDGNTPTLGAGMFSPAKWSVSNRSSTYTLDPGHSVSQSKRDLAASPNLVINMDESPQNKLPPQARPKPRGMHKALTLLLEKRVPSEDHKDLSTRRRGKLSARRTACYLNVAKSRKLSKLGVNRQEMLCVQLTELGFGVEKLEAIVCVGQAQTLEDAMDLFCRSGTGRWNHRFVLREPCTEELCMACREAAKNRVAHRHHVLSISERELIRETPPVVPISETVANGVVHMNAKCVERFGSGVSPTMVGKMADDSATLPSDISGKPCFICGDTIESHSVDYNLELTTARSMAPSTVPPTRNTKLTCESSLLPAESTRLTCVPGKNECVICLEAGTAPNSLAPLLCGHVMCKPCLREYLARAVDSQQFIDVPCPVMGCDYLIPKRYVRLNVDRERYARYKRRRKDLIAVRDGRTVHCPNCGAPVPLECEGAPIISESLSPRSTARNLNSNSTNNPAAKGAAQSMLRCEACVHTMCTQCCRPCHEGLTCEASFSAAYEVISRGKEWQLCPQCKQLVRRRTRCGHMMCEHCLLTFCMFCRKRMSRSHRGANGGTAGKLVSTCVNRRVASSLGTRRLRLHEALLLFLLSPIVGLLLVPYVIGRLVYRRDAGGLELDDMNKRGGSLVLTGLAVLVMVALTPLSVLLFVVLVVSKLFER